MRDIWLKQFVWCTVMVLAGSCLALGQRPKGKAGYDRAARATVLHEANVYVTAEADAQKLSSVTPGHEVVVIQRSGPWIQVFANTDVEDSDDENKPEFTDDSDTTTPASGWIHDKGVVGPSTPGGDAILYGAAANFEAEAAQPHAPKGAAMAAHLLYERVADYYPQSPLAPQAAWRAADIRWQLEKEDISTLPSAKEQAAYLRPQLYEGDMKKVMKMYPGTKIRCARSLRYARQQALRRLARPAQVSGDGVRSLRKICTKVSGRAEGSRGSL